MEWIKDLKPGQRFYFGGDWQTEPGDWEVIEQELEGVACRCTSGAHKGAVSSFFGNVRVKVLA